MRRKKAAEDRSEPASGDGRITPIEVQQVEFRLAFRGYNERDVDAFLDRITEDLTTYIEENERLRTGAAAPSGPDLSEDARAQADAIVAEAREEAAGIVRAAEQQAAAVAASGAAVSGDPRTAVAPFLSREREFLQNLGGLVQGHAEEIKQMVLAVRAHTEAAKQQDEDRGEPATAEAASAAEIRERLGEPEPEADTASIPAETMDEPAYSTEGAPAGEGRERSLRELFWGEE
ncbi:MAG: DivIVA domain-containing protein [Actinomycetota bacterium]